MLNGLVYWYVPSVIPVSKSAAPSVKYSATSVLPDASLGTIVTFLLITRKQLPLRIVAFNVTVPASPVITPSFPRIAVLSDSHVIVVPNMPSVCNSKSEYTFEGIVIYEEAHATDDLSSGYFAPHRHMSLLPAAVKHNVLTLVPSIFCSMKVPSYNIPPMVNDTNGLPACVSHVPVISPETVPSLFKETFFGLLYSKAVLLVFSCKSTSYVPAMLFKEYPLSATLSE